MQLHRRSNFSSTVLNPRSIKRNVFALVPKCALLARRRKPARCLLARMRSARAAGKKEEIAKPTDVLRFGVNNVTRLIETRKASLVLIAHDVDPMTFLPALCRKINVLYAVIKGNVALGRVVPRKFTSYMAVVEVNPDI